MKIAAGARSEHAAATLGVHTDKGTQKLWLSTSRGSMICFNQAKNIPPQTFPSPYDYPILGVAYAI